ncbi:MAG: SPFH domain-containing protein [Chthonomonas sp.]|nr:SPFH domain-containing protein [Chthonomonas sp.]
MGIFDKIRGEFVDIIEWLDDTQDTMVYRFERQGNEIKYGAQLTVRESQAAVFVNEGQIADVFGPGRFELKTENLPILTTLKSWKFGFNSPFKAEVYFVNTKRYTDLKWGTMNPVMMRDAELGVVRVRAFGTYAMRVTDPAKFLQEIAGTDWQFTTDEVTEHLRNQIVSRFAEATAQAGIPVIDLSARYSELGDQILATIAKDIEAIGIELVNFRIENVSLPPEVEEAIDKRSSMGVVGNLQNYTQFQAANAIEKAAENPGGLGAAGVGMGIGQVMGQMMTTGAQPPAPVAAPPALEFHVVVNGASSGPYNMQTLQTMVGGSLTADTLVWRAGMADWQPASKVEALSSLFSSVPPPVPGQ